MSLFKHRRVERRETDFDRSARVLLGRTATPSVALVASIVVCALCAWCFTVVISGWPRVWAQIPFVVCAFLSPALVCILVRDLWRFGWEARLVVAALLSLAGFTFWCATTYFVIHPYSDA